MKIKIVYHPIDLCFLLRFSYPNCTFALLVENTRKASPYNCLICHQPFCQRCSQIWHPNLSCSSAAGQRAAQDITLEMLVKTNLQGGFIRPCPRCKFDNPTFLRLSISLSINSRLLSASDIDVITSFDENPVVLNETLNPF